MSTFFASEDNIFFTELMLRIAIYFRRRSVRLESGAEKIVSSFGHLFFFGTVFGQEFHDSNRSVK